MRFTSFVIACFSFFPVLAVGQEKQFDLKTRIETIAMAPDGKSVAVALRDVATVSLVNLETGDVQQAMLTQLQSVSALAFSPDGKRLLVGGGTKSVAGKVPRTVYIYDVATGKEAVETPQHVSHVFAAASRLPGGKDQQPDNPSKSPKLPVDLKKSPKAKPSVSMLAATNGSIVGSIALWDMTSGKTVGQLKGHTDVVRSLAFLPNGRLVSAADKSVRIWDTVGLKPVGSKLYKANVFTAAASPDGNWIAVSDTTPAVELVNPDKLKDDPVRLPLPAKKGADAGGWKLAFSPDGKYLAGGSTFLFVWDVEKKQEIASFRLGKTALKAIAFTLDSASLVVALPEGELRFYSVSKLMKNE